jgi:soluble lytic murein transglycosylase-like protein
MHMHHTPSTNCASTEPSPIFPNRPCPKSGKRSPGLLLKSRICELAGSVARRRSLRPIARIIVAVAPFMSLNAAPTLFATGACAQRASRPESIDRYAKFVEEASDRFAVPARWIRAVIQIESGGDDHATSPRGAMGLMQIMPGTWVELSVRYGLGFDPFDPRDNIFAGTAYLREMHDRFGSAGFLAAYHAGPSRYEQHLATGQPLPPKTVTYVAAVAPLRAVTAMIAPARWAPGETYGKTHARYRQIPIRT